MTVMADEVASFRFLLRNDLASVWASSNPILEEGEPGVERDTHLLKVGDGATPWNALPYTGERGPAGAPGRGIASVGKTGSAGLVDTYTITYSDATTSTYTVTNGAAGPAGAPGPAPTLTAGAATAVVGGPASVSVTPTGPGAYSVGIGVPVADWGTVNVSTLAAGTPATASLTGTDLAPVLNLGIPQGVQGVSGGRWLSGSGAPASGTGAQGDWYVNTASVDYDFYEKTSSTVWTLRGSLRGPAGSGAVSTVNGVGPDGSGNVNLNPNTDGRYVRLAPGGQQAITAPLVVWADDAGIGGTARPLTVRNDTGQPGIRLVKDGVAAAQIGLNDGGVVEFRNDAGGAFTPVGAYLFAAQPPTAGDWALYSLVTGEPNPRFLMIGNGQMSWGPGAATYDTNLYRRNVGQLATDGTLYLGSHLYARGTIDSARATGDDSVLGSTVTGDAYYRLDVKAWGALYWGPGNAPADTVMYRIAPSALQTDGQFRVQASAPAGPTFSTYAVGDANTRWGMTAEGVMSWGPGTTGYDTTLYRNAVGSLKTDGSLIMGGASAVAAGVVNDTSAALFSLYGGTDGVLGPLAMQLGTHPSATGASRYTFISSGDAGAMRPIALNNNGNGFFGDVGIGTVAPTSRLHVVGNTRVAGLVYADTLRVGAAATAGYVLTADASGNATWAAAGGGSVPAASETVAGIAELATTTEAQAGTDDLRIMTPLKSRQAADARYPKTFGGGGEDWAVPVGTSGAITLNCASGNGWKFTPSGNVTSITLANVPSTTNKIFAWTLKIEMNFLRTIAWPAGWVWMTAQPVLAANKCCDVLIETWDGGSTVYASAQVQP